jgi:antagonist of KipI
MIEIIRSGLLSTVQDLGRYGAQCFGVPTSGAMDAHALRIANRLVGNDDGAAGLEVTLVGPVLQFHCDVLIAVCGGDWNATIGHKPVPMNRPVWIAGGSRLDLGQAVAGCRGYVAFAGGIDVPPVLGSRSTYVRSGFGGLHGRALKKGDRLAMLPGADLRFASLRDRPAITSDGFAATKWSVRVDSERSSTRPQRIRFLAGRHWEQLTAEVRSMFDGENFRVGAASDRMGYRLEGSRPERHEYGNIASEAVAFGTIQLPPDGNPIVLMADRQTVGGYPRVGEVASVDLPLLAQLKPGDSLRFEKISLSEAHNLIHQREVGLAQMQASISALRNQ